MPNTHDKLQGLLQFIDSAPTAFHAVVSCRAMLEASGFKPLSERDPWQLGPGDRCFVTRNETSFVAFVVGAQGPERSGFSIIGAHTDSPCLKLKPIAEINRSGLAQLAVEPYGGMLLSTWMDRDLGLAGRVLVSGDGGCVKSHLLRISRPILRVPNLAIHLDREVNTRGLVLNPQQHMVPVLGLEGSTRGLRELVAAELETPLSGEVVEPKDILDYDLALYDTQPAAIGGVDESFVFAPRLDNLASCHAALVALIESVRAQPLVGPTRLLALWDNEECGSRSAQGAQGPLVRQLMDRIVEARAAGEPQACARAVAASMLLSADMAHALHPNYADRHEPGHLPVIGKGPVIKSNANQSYASDGQTSAVFVSLCRASGFEPQRFVMRSDLPCGSTIGPITAAVTGIRAVDVGNPMLSMHSIREMAGVDDHAKMIAVMTRFLGL
jgi:aspartyl aminopeptidase